MSYERTQRARSSERLCGIASRSLSAVGDLAMHPDALSRVVQGIIQGIMGGIALSVLVLFCAMLKHVLSKG